MIFKITLKTRDTFQEVFEWLKVNMTDSDYVLTPFHGWLYIEFKDDALATMFKLVWSTTIETVTFLPKTK